MDRELLRYQRTLKTIDCRKRKLGPMGENGGLSRVILVIESDHETRVSIRRILEDANYFVISVANGADALSTLQKISIPALIILGSDLSIMTTEQFLKILLSTVDYLNIPLAQIRKLGDPVLEGICHFVQSPPEKGKLLEVVKVCLEN